jgi:putative tricarboxylic transport membrane protein
MTLPVQKKKSRIRGGTGLASGPRTMNGVQRTKLLSEQVVGGAVIALVSVIALVATRDLESGTFAEIGPGLIPRILALLLLILGVAVSATGFLSKDRGDDDAFWRWSPRGIVFILGAVVSFGLTVRSLGLFLAAPLAILVAGWASREIKWLELMIFAAVLTAFCSVLFRFLLNLPIPLAPWLIGY